MAYATLLASVSDDRVIAFREEKLALLEADLSIRCSHQLAYLFLPSELGESLREAIDGGLILRHDLWHPFRQPIWHRSTAVADMESQLRRGWNSLLEKHGPLDSNDWFRIEISKVLEVFGHASASRNGVVSFLEPPMDHERAARVSIPVIERPTNPFSP
jgi:hypothetical protein